MDCLIWSNTLLDIGVLNQSVFFFLIILKYYFFYLLFNLNISHQNNLKTK